MLDLPVLGTLLRETFTVGYAPRIPEPELLVDGSDRVDEYTCAGHEGGVMAQSYLFNCAHICDILRPGDLAIDLACGSANQLAMVAHYNPDVCFVGVDLSDDMLGAARLQLATQRTANVELQKSDITSLDFLSDHSVDAVFSTFSLHHLRTTQDLDRTCSEVDRVLKPAGGLYFFDFSRLKTEKSMAFFAHRRADMQTDLFTLDFYNSLKAAFSVDDFRRVTKNYFAQRASMYAQFPMPAAVVIKSPCRGCHDRDLGERFRLHRRSLPAYAQADLWNLFIRPFRFSGLRTPLLD